MECAEALRVQAYFDGEVDAATAFDTERHLGTCAECQQLLQELKQVRSQLRGSVTMAGTPPVLRQRISQSLEGEPLDRPSRPGRHDTSPRRSRPFWVGVLSGAGGTAVAAGLAFVIFSGLLNNRLPDDLVADHTHALMTSHLIDVVSTDQHTVKPWFAGRTDVSPVVADFTAQGYRLLGGRVDELHHQRAAVTVYQHGRHVINVFSWAAGAGGMPQDVTRNGYHLAFWKSGNVGYCAVSDTGWIELQTLTGLLQEQTARDVPRE
jgi:anti-sigma factor RsiW